MIEYNNFYKEMFVCGGMRTRVHYKLDPETARSNGALWINLVGGTGIKPLQRYGAFERLEGGDDDYCSFSYLGSATTVTIRCHSDADTFSLPNSVTIESWSAGNLALADAEFKRICKKKGLSLVEAVTSDIMQVPSSIYEVVSADNKAREKGGGSSRIGAGASGFGGC